MWTTKEKEAVFNLIENECQKNGHAYEQRIIKMATLINIPPEKYIQIKNNLLSWGKIKTERRKIFINRI